MSTTRPIHPSLDNSPYRQVVDPPGNVYIQFKLAIWMKIHPLIITFIFMQEEEEKLVNVKEGEKNKRR